jgi:hypothetical protein
MSEQHGSRTAVAQIEVNKAEAASGSLFKGGWRPAIGMGVRALDLHYALLCVVPIVSTRLVLHIPEADTSVMMPVLMGMLGLGGLRTFEKTKGINK